MRSATLCGALCFILALASMAAAEEVSINYFLKIDNPRTGLGEVTMIVKGLKSSGFQLIHSGPAGEGWFDTIRAVNSTGEECPVAPVEGGWYVTTSRAEKVTVTYTIRPGGLTEYGHKGLICGEYAALDGSLVFLLLGDEQIVKSVDLALDLPRNWKVILNWPMSSGTYSPDPAFAPLDYQLARSLMCFGEFATLGKRFDTNEVRIHAPVAFPQGDREALADTLWKIYGRIYDLLDCETGRPYNVVCLPVAPDGLPVYAGAWADGQALTLLGTFDPADTVKYTETFGRFVAGGYFTDFPFGVYLNAEDAWLYPAVLGYAEGIAVTSSGKLTENVFFASRYASYSVEAVSNNSSVDIPVIDYQTSNPYAREFIDRSKALVLLMRLDFEVRLATDGAQSADDFIRALYAKGRAMTPGLDAFAVLSELAQADFSQFRERYVEDRLLLLPTWNAFIELLGSAEAPEPGPAVATVDGIPIYQREVEMMADAIATEGAIRQGDDVNRTALSALINEKLMDRQLAEFKVAVVPEAFWRLRIVLPNRVLSLVIAAKRQMVQSFLYNDWLTRSRNTTAIEIIEPQ